MKPSSYRKRGSSDAYPWQIFNRVPKADGIAASLKDIPRHWSLTPLQDKAPKRPDWQTEPFIPHEVIASLITKGEQATSKRTGKLQTFLVLLCLRQVNLPGFISESTLMAHHSTNT
jgi:hypothetical protein